MAIDYQLLKKALIAGAQKYRKECFEGDAKVHPADEKGYSMHSKFPYTSGKEGWLRSLKIEKYLEQIGDNERNILLLAYAVIYNPEGEKLRDYLLKEIETTVFTADEIEAEKRNDVARQFQNISKMLFGGANPLAAGRTAGTGPIPIEPRIEAVIKKLIVDAIRSRNDQYKDTNVRTRAIWAQLNDERKEPKDILMEPFQQELAPALPVVEAPKR
jgi:hypothetical protein